MNCHLVQGVFYGVHIRTLDGHSISFASWDYLGPGQKCSERCLFSRVTDFVAAHVCMLPGSWHHPAQPVHFCHHTENEPMQWQVNRYYHLFPAHIYQCSSHSAVYISELVHLCHAIRILTRQWRYSGGCPKQHGPLARYVISWVRMRRECRERFPRHRRLGIPTCITARAVMHVGIAN